MRGGTTTAPVSCLISELRDDAIRKRERAELLAQTKAKITKEALTIYDQNVWAGRGVQEFPQSSAGT